MTSADTFTFTPNDRDGFTATIAGVECEILPGKWDDTWAVTVNGKLIVTETDCIDHARRQAVAFAKSLESAIAIQQG